MTEKIITFTHFSGVKKESLPASDIKEIKISLEKCLKGELHAVTIIDDSGKESIYPALYLQNCQIEIKDKVKPAGVKYRNF